MIEHDGLRFFVVAGEVHATSHMPACGVSCLSENVINTLCTSLAKPIPLPAKLRLYLALYNLNRGFEATLLSLERLEHLGMFRLENLNAFKVTLEHTRAEANEELA